MLKVKRLNQYAELPVKQHNSAGYDLVTAAGHHIPASERRLIKLGIAIEFPPNYVGRICDRSGMALKQGLHVLAGVIDADYRGEVGVVLLNTSKEDILIKGPARIAQILFYEVADFPVIEVDELNDTSRGQGGWGSTGLR